MAQCSRHCWRPRDDLHNNIHHFHRPLPQTYDYHTTLPANQHLKRTPQRPLTNYERNMAGNLAPPATQDTKTSSIRPSICSKTSTIDASTVTFPRGSRKAHQVVLASPLQQEPLEESDARASAYRSEREDTPMRVCPLCCAAIFELTTSAVHTSGE